MPLPAHALTIHGGCNCEAIRYRIDIPEVSERPANHYFSETARKTGNQQNLTLPMVAIDHCNDCRRATGSILPLWLLTPIAFVSSSCLLRSATSPSTDGSNSKPKVDEEKARSHWLPAAEVFTPGPVSSNTFLSFYESSEGRRKLLWEVRHLLDICNLSGDRGIVSDA